MRHSRLAIIVLLLVTIWPIKAQAASDTDHIVISEVQTGSTASASQEFVELYNPTDQAVALDGWQVQYRAASSTSSWANRTGEGIVGTIPAHGFFLIASTAYLSNADNPFSSGMAAGGGSLRIIDTDSNGIDMVGWGTGVEFEASPAEAPAAGSSIERLPGETNETGGNGSDSDNNQDDFLVRISPQPQTSASDLEVPGEIGEVIDFSNLGTDQTPTEQPNPTSQAPEDQPGAVTVTATVPPAVVINELFIDPASPQTDSKDEFIELYNPGSAPATLTGYKLKTGTDFHDSYTLPALTIAPGTYQVFYAPQTKLSLTNSGGAAELVDPAGNVIDVSAEYDGSLNGFSFSRFGDDWQWTTNLTPSSANIFTAPAVKAAAVKKTTAKATKKKAAKKTAAKKKKATKVKAIKAAKVKAPKAKAGATSLTAASQSSGLAAKWLIIGLATLTIGYAIYEFRYDIQNFYQRLRSKYHSR